LSSYHYHHQHLPRQQCLLLQIHLNSSQNKVFTYFHRHRILCLNFCWPDLNLLLQCRWLGPNLVVMGFV
jgi:hypothetical protein